MIVHVEKGYLPPDADDPIRNLCWDAQEVLATYMKRGVDLTTPDEAGEHTDEDDGQGVCIHDTALVPVNVRQAAYFSNAPQIAESEEDLGWLLTPGYVALRWEPHDDTTIDNKRHLDELHGQLIFQLPRPAEIEPEPAQAGRLALPDATGVEAAIYYGFELSDANQIGARQTGELRRIDKLIRGMRGAYRQMIETDPGVYEETYFSQVPMLSVADQFADFLEGLL